MFGAGDLRLSEEWLRRCGRASSSAIGGTPEVFFVDTGLLKEDEFESTREIFKQHMSLDVQGVRAGTKFITALNGVVEPERKRKIIGGTFIDVFEEEARKFGGVDYLVQGTLYPDVIESVPVRGPRVIKSHHMLVGYPKNASQATRASTRAFTDRFDHWPRNRYSSNDT